MKRRFYPLICWTKILILKIRHFLRKGGNWLKISVSSIYEFVNLSFSEDDETEHLRKFKSQVGEDEAEMLPIKLRTGELVRLKKKVEPMVENELEEEEDDKSGAKTKVDEEDFSNLSASELLAKRRELLEEIRGKIASAAHALTINPHENVCIDCVI